MMKKNNCKSILLLIALGSLSACDQNRVRPYLEGFTSSVYTAGNAADRSFQNNKLDQGIADLRRNVLAKQSSLYALENRCAPLEPLVVDMSQAPSDFSEYCDISAKVFDPASQQISQASENLPDGDPIVEAANARRLIRALSQYAAALDDVLNSDTPASAAAAAASALNSLDNLAEEKISPRDYEAFGARLLSREGRDLAERVTSEALEAYRYRLLKDVILDADPAVQNASRAVAVWFNRENDRAEIASAYASLETAIDQAQPGSAADLARVERAYENTRLAEESAGWRVFWSIGVAHAAMKNSLASGGTKDKLRDANDRIKDLVDSVKAFRETR